jgi:uncharacterized membrane protein
MRSMNRERDLLRLFDLGLLIKAVDGVLEALGALTLLFVSPRWVLRVVEFATAGELARDPDDPVAMSLREAAHAFSLHPHYFFAAYLFAHGIIKVVLVYGIFARKRYAYQVFIAALGVFGAYEAFRAIRTDSWLLAALAIFDILLMALAAHEYRVRGRFLEARKEEATPRPEDSRGA